MGTSVFSNSLIWFGAGISIAEILTGSYFAPLGFSKGIAAILIGHAIGCALFFFTGYIGALSKKSSMETTRISFGKIGGSFFALLNVLQLVGWTGIMIYDGSLAANGIANSSSWIWALVIGALIVLWILIGITNIGKLNLVAMTALFVLTLVLCKVIFFGKNAVVAIESAGESLSFGAAVELAVAMPLSWLPLISDYTKDSAKPFAATLASTLTYFAVSCWMYIIGMGAALLTGTSDIAQIMLKAGLGIPALVIIVLSTVTTTFLDAFSAGISFRAIFKNANTKIVGIIVALVGTLAAVFYPMDNITDFLYLIGSVFAPMTAILIADFFVTKNESSKKRIDFVRIALWLVGFILYRILMKYDIPCGNTLPDMAITFVLTLIASGIQKKLLKD
ncbi:MAG: putative hydroxymethylpyrimidine transporter CytX [Treponema sp.]|nr:putative hydroxymethylpyrimidine transporter CytX [Treponema sp.]MBR0477297.1 putative hydroxymethylpyrimidine transporter CytX [Treponema sp.]